MVQAYIAKSLGKIGYSHTEIKRTPLGDKVIIYTSKPGLVVGRKGENINNLTKVLKKKFKMENPQIEIGEIPNPFMDAQLVADRIASTLERFGSKRFKSVGYKVLQQILDAGALGAEIVIGGKVPSTRAKSWRFKAGYIKKSGNIAENLVKKAMTTAELKSGTIGIKVSIMTPDIELPDRIEIRKSQVVQTEVKTEDKKEAEKKPKRTRKKKETKVEEKKEVKGENVEAKKE